ncbi:MAG: cytochrome P450 [Acidimicrobiales bacterium]
MTSEEQNLPKTNEVVNINDPGSVPYVDISVNNFGEILSTTQSITEQGWVVLTPAGPLVVGYKQIKNILRNPEWISLLSSVSMLDQMESGSADLNKILEQAQRVIPEVPSSVQFRPNVLSVEGDDHKRLRRLVNASFTTGNTSKHREFMRSHAQSLLKSIRDSGQGELVSEFCRPYPVPVICRVLGVNDSDWKLFDEWADTIFSALDADVESVIGRLGDITRAQKELDSYVQNLIKQRVAEPKDDLLTELVKSHYNEDRLSHDELSAMAEAILLAGTDTTRNQLGAMLAVLADHPEQYQALREDPSLVPIAVEEALRYISAVRTTGRLASRDQVIDGVYFPAGSTVLLGLHAGGLAEAEDQGFEFNILRNGKCPHLAFGSGAHHCLGASLARAELQEALTAFIEIVPRYELTSPVSWKPLSMGIWGPSKLEIKIIDDEESKIHPDRSARFTSTIKKPVAMNDESDTSRVDKWIREAAQSRETLRRSIPNLIRKPKFPPLGRLIITVFRFGKAFISWKVIDRKLAHPIKQEKLYARLRNVAEQQGPTYVKLAQLISAAEGVFPEALVTECKKCRDQVSPEPWNKIEKIINTELGPLPENFTNISEDPIAAASIAQVHEATLRNGQTVVLKVQRPGIRRKVANDLKVMAWVAPKLIGKIPVSALANPPALVELFAETICEELDFRLEVANLFEIDRVLSANQKHTWEIPTPELSLVTEKVIVMSKISGVSLGESISMGISSDQTSTIFRQMVEGLLEGAVIHGVFHGDFHAGNVFLNNTNKIGLVDFGITGRLDGERRLAFLRYVVGIMTGDVESQVLGIKDLGAFPEDSDIGLIINEFQLERDNFDPLELSEEEFIDEFRTLIKNLLAEGARIPKELMLFVKNFAYLSSVMQELDPDMDLLTEFLEVASGFFSRNGVRVATEIGFSLTADDVTDMTFRRVAGLRENVSTLTWKELGERRSSLVQRMDRRSIKQIID